MHCFCRLASASWSRPTKVEESVSRVFLQLTEKVVRTKNSYVEFQSQNVHQPNTLQECLLAPSTPDPEDKRVFAEMSFHSITLHTKG